MKCLINNNDLIITIWMFHKTLRECVEIWQHGSSRKGWLYEENGDFIFCSPASERRGIACCTVQPRSSSSERSNTILGRHHPLGIVKYNVIFIMREISPSSKNSNSSKQQIRRDNVLSLWNSSTLADNLWLKTFYGLIIPFFFYKEVSTANTSKTLSTKLSLTFLKGQSNAIFLECL